MTKSRELKPILKYKFAKTKEAFDKFKKVVTNLKEIQYDEDEKLFRLTLNNLQNEILSATETIKKLRRK